MKYNQIEGAVAQQINPKSFMKAVEGINPPPDPTEVERAVNFMKSVYHGVAGLSSTQAAEAAKKLSQQFYKAPARDQSRIGQSIIQTAYTLGMDTDVAHKTLPHKR